MDIKLNLTQKQSISQRHIQGLQILQMSGEELKSYLEKEALENPVLEVTWEESSSFYRERIREWMNSRRNTAVRGDYTDEDGNQIWDRISDGRQEEQDIHAVLFAQINQKKYSRADLEILHFLIESIDERGYFPDRPEEAAVHLKQPTATILRLLEVIQGLEPPGIGARDLRECLLLQLQRKKSTCTVAELIIRDHLESVAKGHLEQITTRLRKDGRLKAWQEKLGRPLELADVKKACREIRMLNPLPGNIFDRGEQTVYIRPDLYVLEKEGELVSILPEKKDIQISASLYYTNLLKTTDDKETQEYLREKIRKTRELVRDIRNRQSSLEKVTDVILRCQKDFFSSGGKIACRPLSLADIAEETGLHESTVCRTIHGKYLQCAAGLFSMRYFLPSGAAHSVRTGEELSREQIQIMLKKIIQEENPEKPLSDEKIALKLKEAGISVARRTVNKYRMEMGIPDRSGRKQRGDH